MKSQIVFVAIVILCRFVSPEIFQSYPLKPTRYSLDFLNLDLARIYWGFYSTFFWVGFDVINECPVELNVFLVFSSFKQRTPQLRALSLNVTWTPNHFDRVSSFQEEREGQIEELSLLRVNLFETMTERDELQSTVDVQEEELETIKSDLSQARARCFELEASQVQSRSELDSATSSLKQELESMRRQQEEAEAFLSQQRSEFELATATLQQELESLREKKFGESEAFVAQQRTEFESKISTLTQELEESKSASSQQRTVVDALQQELDSLHRQHREAEAFLAQQRTEFELTMSNLQQELESLRQKKFGESEAFVAEQRAQFEATVAALKQELEASETSSSQQRAELDDLQRELESLRQLRGQSDEFLSQERTEFELAISTLRGELESMAKQRTQYELVISTSQQELESLRQANATLAGDSKSQEELQLRCSSLQHEVGWFYANFSSFRGLLIRDSYLDLQWIIRSLFHLFTVSLFSYYLLFAAYWLTIIHDQGLFWNFSLVGKLSCNVNAYLKLFFKGPKLQYREISIEHDWILKQWGILYQYLGTI